MPDQPKGREPGKGELSPEDKTRFESRVNELGDKLGKAKAAHVQQRTGGSVLQGRGMAYGFRMASEFVAAIIVGGLLGYVFDLWLGSKPWLFLVFFVLGLAAGILNVIRGYQKMQAEIATKTGGDIGRSIKDNDDD